VERDRETKEMGAAGHVQLADGVYWVGSSENLGGLQCNPYLLVDQGEGVLFDPGSVLDFEAVLQNVTALIPLEKIRYVVLHHQDPDFCSGVPLFEKAGGRFTIVTHWRTQTIIRYYGLSSPYYLVHEHDYRLELSSGRELIFIPTPYLHFPGAITTLDKKSGILFSSDLFGAFSNHFDFYAEEDYIEKMKTFHEHYMPSNDVLRPVMETLLLLDIRMIAPQHGSIIKDNVKTHIKVLRDLECGVFLNPVKKNIKKAGGYAGICSMVLKRLAATYGAEELGEALEGLSIETKGPDFEIVDFTYGGMELWEKLFENIYLKKGSNWLLVIEPLVRSLSQEYEMPFPGIFSSEIRSIQQQTLLLRQELEELKEINDRLERNIEQTQGRITTCPVTGLHNETFFREYLKTELEESTFGAAEVKLSDRLSAKNGEEESKCLAFVGIDNVPRIKYLYGDAEAENVLKGIVYLLNEEKDDRDLMFRLDGWALACFFPATKKETALELCERIRNEVRVSKKFLEPVTVSVGLASLQECGKLKDEKGIAQTIYRVTAERLRLAKGKGGDMVVFESEVDAAGDREGKILIADNDGANREVLRSFLTNLKYAVISANDGEEALELVERELPDLILSEAILPKMDGFLLCEKIRLQASTRNIPFLVLSSLKNEDSVKRALSLDIEHYFQKPYMMTEVLGIIQKKIREGGRSEDRD